MNDSFFKWHVRESRFSCANDSTLSYSMYSIWVNNLIRAHTVYLFILSSSLILHNRVFCWLFFKWHSYKSWFLGANKSDIIEAFNLNLILIVDVSSLFWTISCTPLKSMTIIISQWHWQVIKSYKAINSFWNFFFMRVFRV